MGYDLSSDDDLHDGAGDQLSSRSIGALPRVLVSSGLAIALCLWAILAFAPHANAAGEFEPNDTRDTAYGPLAGGVDYKATFETDNDVDWYVFYVRQYSQMDFSATGVGSDCPNFWASLYLLDGDGKYVDDFDPGRDNETNHLYLTLEPGRYYLEISSYGDNCTGDAYRFRIDPAAAITTSRECGEGIVAKDAVTPELAKVSGELTENSEALAETNSAVSSAKAELSKFKRRWDKFKRRSKAALRKLKRDPTTPSFKKKRVKRRLASAKKRLNRRLTAAKAPAKRKLTAAKTARGKVLEGRAGLQAIAAQHATALSQADAQIATYC